MSTVCLFDIDGTLLNSGGAGQLAMEAALLEAFGVTGPYQDILAAGRTDKAITTDLFAHHKIEVTDDVERIFMNAYLSHLPHTLNNGDGRILPGVNDLLERLTNHAGVTLGLLTGNYQVGADLKLKHYAIHQHFHFGGYGDTHHHRDDVARVAYRAACAHLKSDVPAETVWVIGDTPSDITCARAIGANVIAVATGIYASEELRSYEPDYLYEDLSDVETVLEILSQDVA